MILSLIGQLVISILFLISSISKCLDIDSFRISIKKFGLLKDKFINISSYLLIISELSISILVIFFFNNLITLNITIAIMLLFIAVLVKALLQKNVIDCNCFGKSRKRTNKFLAIIRNILIVALVLFSWIFRYEDQFSILERLTMFIILLNVALYFVVVKERRYLDKGGTHHV